MVLLIKNDQVQINIITDYLKSVIMHNNRGVYFPENNSFPSRSFVRLRGVQNIFFMVFLAELGYLNFFGESISKDAKTCLFSQFYIYSPIGILQYTLYSKSNQFRLLGLSYVHSIIPKWLYKIEILDWVYDLQ